MKKRLLLVAAFILVIFQLTAISASAHPGRTDANGGHVCKTNCAKWGLKNGQYHYHNPDGSATLTKPGSQTTKPKPKPQVKPKPQAQKVISIYIDGVKQTYDQSPVIENGRTIVPLRGIFESLGASVAWDSKKQLVTAHHAKTKISLTIGSKSPQVNGKVVAIDAAAKVVKGSTFVPLRFVSESLGATVKYDSNNSKIEITSKK